MYWKEKWTDVSLNQMMKRYYNADQIQAMNEKATTDNGKILAKEVATSRAQESPLPAIELQQFERCKTGKLLDFMDMVCYMTYDRPIPYSKSFQARLQVWATYRLESII